MALCKPSFTLSYSHMWLNFNPENVFLTTLLRKRFTVRIVSTNADVHIFGPFGNNSQIRSRHPNSFLLYYTGENVRPPYHLCDASFSFDWSENKKNYRLPLYYAHIDKLVRSPFPTDATALLAEKTHFCCFLVSNPKCVMRNNFFHLLSKYKKVHSGGKYLNNIGSSVRDAWSWIRQFKFMICFENSEYNGYTTEKLSTAYACGTVGIYWGNPLVAKDFNTKAFISLYDHASVHDVVEHVKRLDQNNDLYLEKLRQPLFDDNKRPRNLEDGVILDFFEKTVKECKPHLLTP